MSWPKKITVDKRIVRILSGSTYANFPSAIKELITNSYDADAETVKIDIDLASQIVTVHDNGKGMDENDFAFYLRIAGKSRKKEKFTQNRRRIIGQFGVGFLSALPFCEKYVIETTRKGTDEVLHATISSYEYFTDDYQTIDVDEIPIPGGIKRRPELTNDQFTRIRLVGFSKLTLSFFEGKYKLENRRNTKFNYTPLDLLKWELSEYLPLEYDSNDLLGEKLNSIIEDDSIISFNVIFNGHKLFRNVHANNILEISNDFENIGGIKFKYQISTDYAPIKPTEGRYIMLRNLNVGVGERTTFGLGLEGKVYARLAHLTGEVNILEGLNDLISVSRDKFNFSPDYEQLKDFIRSKLSKWANELDKINSVENTIKNLSDTKNVSSIENLKVDKVTRELESLENRGFKINVPPPEEPKDWGDRPVQESQNLDIKIDKQKREVNLTKSPNSFFKTIEVRNKEFKLRSENWDYRYEMFPAVKIKDDITMVNESYPLFKDKNHFDTFLKFHLLLIDYLNSNKIEIKTYKSLCEDLLLTFKSDI